MKVAQVGDIHISDGRLSEWKILLKQIADSILQKKPDLVVFTGDMFVHRDRLSQMQVELCRQFFKDYLGEVHVIAIPGNHDTSMSAEKIDSLSAIFAYDNVSVYDKIGEHVDRGMYRYHMFPYPSRKEMDRIGVKNIGDFIKNQQVFDLFDMDPDRHNILIFHGILEGFSLDGGFVGSEEVISVGKDLGIPPEFYRQFNAVMAGHLHKYQANKSGDSYAVYAGCPCPLTFNDSDPTGWILWTETAGRLVPEFIELEQRYPFVTYDAGDVSMYASVNTDEVVRRVYTTDDFTDIRVRVKYALLDSQKGVIDHTKIAKSFKNAKDVKVVPIYKDSSKLDTRSELSFEDFQTNIGQLIDEYIDAKKYDPAVKEIARKVEEKAQERTGGSEHGIHFRPISLRISNFKAFGASLPEIKFDDLSTLTGVFGDNRAGKSSLVESILWALFDKTLRNKQSKSVIRNGEKSANVSITFESCGVLYRVDRERTNSIGSVNLYQDVSGEWIPINGADKPSTENKIQSLVGSFDIFTSIIYSAQNKIDLLINKKPSERKQIILDCLQVDVLERRQAIIAEMRKNLKDRQQQEMGKLELLTEKQAKLISRDPDFYIEKYVEETEDKKMKVADLVTEINRLAINNARVEELQQNVDKLTASIEREREKIRQYDSKVKQKQDQLTSYTDLLNDIGKIDAGIDRLNHLEERYAFYEEEKRKDREREHVKKQLAVEYKNVSGVYDEQIELIKKSKAELVGQLNNLAEIDCPADGCPINEKVRKQKSALRLKIDELDTDIEKKLAQKEVALSTVKDKIAAVTTELEASLYDSTEHMLLIQTLNEERKNKWHELKASVSTGKDLLSDIEGILQALIEQRQEHRDARDALVAERGGYHNELAILKSATSRLETLRRNLGDLNSSIKEMESKITRLQGVKEEIHKLSKEILEKNQDIDNIRNNILHHTKYAEIVSHTGVIFSLVDKSVPVIERFAQNLLNDTTHGMINITMESFRLLEKGTKSDDVSIFIHDSKGSRDIAEGSGAELFLATMALRAAMANLLSLRMGSKVELFIVDEGFGNLEDKTIIMAKDMFRRLSKLFNRVIIITHVGEVQDLVDTIIEVSSDDGGLTSKFEVRDMS